MQPNNDEAVIPREDKDKEDAQPPAKRPRRKAAQKSREKMTKQAAKGEADDNKEKEEDSKPAEKSKEPSSEGVVMDVDAMATVMEFICPRSLFNVALTCKSLLARVTTTMVVRSALIHGNNTKKTFEELYKLMKNHSIHPPSPLRLLRLANGRKCEFCLENSVWSLYQDMNIGAFSCWNCLTKGEDRLTKAFKSSCYWANPLYHFILKHPRSASRDLCKGLQLWLAWCINFG